MAERLLAQPHGPWQTRTSEVQARSARRREQLATERPFLSGIDPSSPMKEQAVSAYAAAKAEGN